MKYLILSEHRKKKIEDFLNKTGSVTWVSDKVSEEDVKNFDWIVSYGYRHILSKSIIESSRNKIINLHISYLPFNRGADPNYWSFKENTPKGVTIHFMDEGIDTGPILIQKLCKFDESHTLKTSYNILIETIEELFFDNFDKIISGDIKPIRQNSLGTYHSKKDIKTKINYNININKI